MPTSVLPSSYLCLPLPGADLSLIKLLPLPPSAWCRPQSYQALTFASLCLVLTSLIKLLPLPPSAWCPLQPRPPWVQHWVQTTSSPLCPVGTDTPSASCPSSDLAAPAPVSAGQPTTQQSRDMSITHLQCHSKVPKARLSRQFGPWNELLDWLCFYWYY